MSNEPAQQHQGMLQKHVNSWKGFQGRYFVVNTVEGRLEYWASKENYTAAPSDPRGYIKLIGAEVAPKEDDSISFNVFASTQQVFQLKGENARDRQQWVDAIRAAIQTHNRASCDPLAVRVPSLPQHTSASASSAAPTNPLTSHTSKNSMSKKKDKKRSNSYLLLPSQEMTNAREALNAAEVALSKMSELIAAYPRKSKTFKPQASSSNMGGAPGHSQAVVPKAGESSGAASNYESMLTLKAFSVACLQDLKVCFETVQSEYIRNRAT